MGPYLYVTIDWKDTEPRTYGAIVVEDVREDYQELVRFCGDSFSSDVQAYHSWAEAAMEKNEAVEIYESDELRDRIQALNEE